MQSVESNLLCLRIPWRWRWRRWAATVLRAAPWTPRRPTGGGPRLAAYVVTGVACGGGNNE
jgi:hypothetical protein